MRDEVPWLDDQESLAWRGWIDAASVILRLIEQDLKAESGMTFDDYEVLVELSESTNRRMRLADLADAVVHSPSRLSQRVDRMAEKGLVRRERDDDDRRGIWAVLTDEGLAILEAAAPAHVVSVRRHLIDRLDRDSIGQLAEILPKLVSDVRNEAPNEG